MCPKAKHLAAPAKEPGQGAGLWAEDTVRGEGLEHYAMSRSKEWYTPARYLQLIRALMGGIDLDPASCSVAQRTVQATRYFTADDNGLAHPWPGRVFLNPPYGRGVGGLSNQGCWSHRLIEQYEQGITTQAVLLVTAATSEKWFQPLWAYPVCFTDHRIAFVDAHGHKVRGNTKGAAFVYMGNEKERFAELFSAVGTPVFAAGLWAKQRVAVG